MKKEDFIYLIYREYKGTIKADEKDNLDYWLSASADNQKIKKDILLSMNLLDDYAPEFEMNLDDEFLAIQSKLEVAQVSVDSAVKNKDGVKVFSMKPWMYAAASLIVLIGVFSIFNISNNQELIMASTNAEETKEIILVDGSKVWLNENSTLEYPNKFDGESRRISLIGEAYFEVARDINQKFEVQTKESVTTVLGTSFVIKAMPGDEKTSILVRTGKVQFEDLSTKDMEILKPFDKAYLDHATDNIERTKVSDLNELSWKTNKLSFKSMRIEDIFEYLEGKFDIEINDSNLNIKECKFTMTPQQADVDQILSNIKKVHKIQIQKIGKRIYTIQGGEC